MLQITAAPSLTVRGVQAIISGTFSIIRQSLMLGCFPRVKIVHTSGLVEGQIYIPEANWIMMLLTIIVVAGFRDQDAISNAYGVLHPPRRTAPLAAHDFCPTSPIKYAEPITSTTSLRAAAMTLLGQLGFL